MDKEQILSTVEQLINAYQPRLDELTAELVSTRQVFIDQGFKRVPLWYDNSEKTDEYSHIEHTIKNLSSIREQLIIFNRLDYYYYEILHPPSQVNGQILGFKLEQENKDLIVLVCGYDGHNEINILEIKKRIPVKYTPMRISQMSNNLLERKNEPISH